MRTRNLKSYRVLIPVLLFLSGTLALAKAPPPEPVGPPPDLTKGGKLINTGSFMLGPTGARGRMFVRAYMTGDARQILITEVEAGSPADGLLAVGDLILGIGDKKFDDDARKSFGRAINQAETEAYKGVLSLLRWRGGAEKVAPRSATGRGAHGAPACG